MKFFILMCLSCVAMLAHSESLEKKLEVPSAQARSGTYKFQAKILAKEIDRVFLRNLATGEEMWLSGDTHKFKGLVGTVEVRSSGANYAILNWTASLEEEEDCLGRIEAVSDAGGYAKIYGRWILCQEVVCTKDAVGRKAYGVNEYGRQSVTRFDR